jgi:hypothetical protein
MPHDRSEHFGPACDAAVGGVLGGSVLPSGGDAIVGGDAHPRLRLAHGCEVTDPQSVAGLGEFEDVLVGVGEAVSLGSVLALQPAHNAQVVETRSRGS